jgi:hypothetical protein
MGLNDILITPIFLTFLLYILFVIRKKESSHPIIKKYFLWAACAKIFGAIALGLVYYFYYKGGDTIVYYKGATIINELFSINPKLALDALLRNCRDPLPIELRKYFWNYMYIYDNGSFFVVRLAGWLSIIDFNSYVVTSILFGMFSFSGSWALYRTLMDMYPEMYKELAYAVFFLPSVVFWGSGMLKDSITFGALGWFFYGFYHIFIAKDQFKKPIIMLLLGAFLLIHIKIYILMSLMPAIAVWLFLSYNQKIKSKVTRTLLLPVFLFVSLVAGILATYRLAEQDAQFKLTNLTTKVKVTNEWLTYVSKHDKGSYYDIGISDYSMLGLLQVFPKAVNVTLFRPYLWEARNPVMLMSAFESLFFLLFSLRTLWRVGFFNALSIAKNNPIVIAFLIFSLGMSFAVGITSANFGTLVRYKIPVMPFYIASFFIIEHIHKKGRRKKVEGRGK